MPAAAICPYVACCCKVSSLIEPLNFMQPSEAVIEGFDGEAKNCIIISVTQ
jgi:hypothetical protein